MGPDAGTMCIYLYLHVYLYVCISHSGRKRSTMAQGQNLPPKPWPVCEHRCWGPHCHASRDTKLLRCRACLAVKYCSADCQRDDWHRHKTHCKASKRLCTSDADEPMAGHTVDGRAQFQ